MIDVEVIIGTIRISMVGTIQNFRGRNNLEMIGREVHIIEMIEETLRIETGHMREVEAEAEIIEEDVVGTEEAMDLGIELGPTLEIKVKEGVITIEDHDIL